MLEVKGWNGAVMVLGFLIVLVGCDKPPDSELTAAKNALEEARNAGAADYVAEEVKAVQDDLQKAQEEITAQETKISLARNYDKARELLGKAKAEAEKAKTDAVSAKEKAKGEAETGFKEAQAALGQAKVLLAQVPTGKGSKRDIEALKGVVQTAEAMLLNIKTALDHGDYVDARAKEQSVKEKAAAAIEQVKHAMEKTRKGRK
jgi:hypothetical protein